MKALTILGMFMMGVTAARFVTIQSSLSFVLSEREFALQSILDSILPGILPQKEGVTNGENYFCSSR